jgi:hypothetical protein
VATATYAVALRAADAVARNQGTVRR